MVLQSPDKQAGRSPWANGRQIPGMIGSKFAHKGFLQGVECRAPCPQHVAVMLAAEESLPAAGFLATHWAAEIWLGARIIEIRGILAVQQIISWRFCAAFVPPTAAPAAGAGRAQAFPGTGGDGAGGGAATHPKP